MTIENASVPGLVHLSIQMLCDALQQQACTYSANTQGDSLCLSGCLLYCGQETLRNDILYILPAERALSFPRDSFSYITSADLSGSAPHIRCLNRPLDEILNIVLAEFDRYRTLDAQLRYLLNERGTLTDLCDLGSAFFGNPIYIHDDLFAVIAFSDQVDAGQRFDYDQRTHKYFIPLWLINDFKFDPAYQKTLELHHAELWDGAHSPDNNRAYFINLWDGKDYLGRLLMEERGSPLLSGQLVAMELLAKYAVLLLQRDGKNQSHAGNNFEHVLTSLLSGNTPDPRELELMLRTLDWNETDHFVCLKLQDQYPRASIWPGSVLAGKVSSLFKSCCCFHYQRRLCIVVNLTVSHIGVNTIRLALAPYVRDSCMYGGISNPVQGIYTLAQAFRQTDIILNYITSQDSSQWLLPFSSCAIYYLRNTVTQELPPAVLAHPALLSLYRYDKENGTPYYSTLQAFLLHERSIPRTADALIIHRTTLTYRLEKISELVRLNLDDDTQRQYLLVSFFILGDSLEDVKNAPRPRYKSAGKSMLPQDV